MGDISKARGGRVKWYNFHHSFKDLVPPEKYFESHPEYFSERNGKRTPREICLTNPMVQEIAKKKLLTWIHDNPECSVFSVAKNDVMEYCTCPTCRALQEKKVVPEVRLFILSMRLLTASEMNILTFYCIRLLTCIPCLLLVKSLQEIM